MKTREGNDGRQNVIRVVRGDLPLHTLQCLGISIRFHDGESFLSTRVDDPKKFTWGVEGSHVDLALGLLHCAGEPTKLQQWERFVMASEIDVDDTVPIHDLVMEAVWDAAFTAQGNVIGAHTLVRLQQIAEDEGDSECK